MCVCVYVYVYYFGGRGGDRKKKRERTLFLKNSFNLFMHVCLWACMYEDTTSLGVCIKTTHLLAYRYGATGHISPVGTSL